MAPRPGDATVDEKGRDGLRGLRVEDLWAVLLRQDPGAAGVDEQRGVPGGQEPDGGGRLWIGQGRARQVEELGAVFRGETAKLELLEDGADPLRVQAHPVGELGERGGTEGCEMAAGDRVNPARLVEPGRRWPEPGLRSRVEIRPPALPRSGRRHPDQV